MAAPVAAKVAVHVAQSKTGRRIICAVLALVLVIATLPAFLVGGAAMVLALGSTSGNGTCPTPEAAGGYSSEQLGNAQRIQQAAADMQVPASGVKIAIMVALVESNLMNLANSNVPESLLVPNQGTGSDHDSVGIMQQRPSSGWGTVSELMNPEFAARAFFGGPSGPNGGSPRGLLDVAGWESMEPGVAAQTVQVSAFPDRYQERAADADAVLAALGMSAGTCETGDGVPPQVVGGWANPIGMQSWSTYPNHAGGAMDVHVQVGTPVYAPAAGRVFDLSEGCGGRVLGVQHDVQYTTAFAHLDSFAVSPGEQVTAGQLIGYSGASGACVQGPHLHFEVRVGPNPNSWGSFTPAYKFMRERGIEMGPCTAGCDLYPM